MTARNGGCLIYLIGKWRPPFDADQRSVAPQLGSSSQRESQAIAIAALQYGQDHQKMHCLGLMFSADANPASARVRDAVVDFLTSRDAIDKGGCA